MPSFNCACDDDGISRRELSDLRISLMRRLGFSAQVLNPPPGMNELLNEFLFDAQEQLYRRYASLRTERIYSWPMIAGQRYYGIGASDEAAYTVTVGNSTTKYGFGPAAGGVGSVTPTPVVVGDATVESFYTDGANTYMMLSTGNSIDTTEWEAVTVDTAMGPIDLRFEYASGLGTDTMVWATPVWTAADEDEAYSFTFNGVCSQHKLDPYKVSWVGVTDQNDVWYPLIQGIPPELYTRAQLTPGWPTRYEISDCIEVFPAPQAPYTLRVKGHFGLERFTQDTDKTTIDSHPVFLFALGMAKAHYGRSDASAYTAQALTYIGGLVAGAHQTARYIPNPRVEVEAMTPPRMVAFDE